MENAPTACTAVSQNKHDNMQDAIDGIDTVIARAKGLLDRINGSGLADPAPEQPRLVATLSGVLNSGSAEINDKCTQLRSYLDEIEGALF